jgi:hypothetical protein
MLDTGTVHLRKNLAQRQKKGEVIVFPLRAPVVALPSCAGPVAVFHGTELEYSERGHDIFSGNTYAQPASRSLDAFFSPLQVQKMLPKHALAYASFVFFAAGQS